MHLPDVDQMQKIDEFLSKRTSNTYFLYTGVHLVDDILYFYFFFAILREITKEKSLEYGRVNREKLNYLIFFLEKTILLHRYLLGNM